VTELLGLSFFVAYLLTASQGLPTRFRLSDGEKASRRAA
jgi:hypothetical protein